MPGVEVRLTSQKTGDVDSTTSDNAGIFLFPLLAPGAYELHARKAQFDTLRVANVKVAVTETSRVDIRLRLAKIVGKAQVCSEGPMVETDTIALGRVVDGIAIAGLPLVTRNFTQITALSPGVATGVSNAGELGPGLIRIRPVSMLAVLSSAKNYSSSARIRVPGK